MMKKSISNLIRTPIRNLFKQRAEWKLLAGIECLSQASLEQLKNVEWLEAAIGRIGLKYLPSPYHEVYGDDVHRMNFHGDGLFQIPRQFARFLALAAAHHPKSFLEIGTNNGWSAAVAAAYLARFVPDFHLTTIDIADHFRAKDALRERVSVQFVLGKTSDDFKGMPFDVCFIDGDHSFPWVERDFNNVGQFAKVCAFHDINDLTTDRNEGGGSRKHWNQIKGELKDRGTFTELLDHSKNQPVMGIGVYVRS